MKRETLFLKFVVILMGIPVLALSIFVLPGFAEYAAKIVPEFPYIKYFFSIGLYITAVIFFFALYQTLKLLSYIDQGKAFSELSVNVLKKIKYSAIAIGAIYVAELPIIYLIADADDAPGLILIGLIITFASVVISVFAAVLEKLLKHAFEIKSENDLTV
ncbi:DUF2975 domain-containing protein [Defluviitalea saccharophila]|uniref:DUF2975 domain-containing protein n=1 Tax=Defluviitalea saccharophila TaxID=879970 RepID=A0ABZ2Y7N7_9FIRM